MGVVYLAEHMTLRRQAALKIIVPDLAEDSSFRERFVREARIAATLTHPNVVTVYDAGEVEGLLFIAMQYIPGADLAAVLHEERRLGPYRALDVCRQVAARAGRRSHPRPDPSRRQARQHPDRRPPGVPDRLRPDQGAQGAPRSGLTRSGEVVGTTHYLAPEQVEGREVDARADVYALGCLLFHLLTGEVPFPRDSDMAVMYAHVHDDPPKLTAKRPTLPEGLDHVRRQGDGQGLRAALRHLRRLRLRRPRGRRHRGPAVGVLIGPAAVEQRLGETVDPAERR